MMPTISQFYGIRVVMFLKQKEHNPPHIHAYYGNNQAKFLINSGELMVGDFPKQGRKLMKAFIIKYKKELMKMWETGKYVKLPPLN